MLEQRWLQQASEFEALAAHLIARIEQQQQEEQRADRAATVLQALCHKALLYLAVIDSAAARIIQGIVMPYHVTVLAPWGAAMPW